MCDSNVIGIARWLTSTNWLFSRILLKRQLRATRYLQGILRMLAMLVFRRGQELYSWVATLLYASLMVREQKFPYAMFHFFIVFTDSV
ncbi:unnamed protein product [Euphydryas editha]|uniref:Uncharacterized protein n=1 Tax=Euphydryas editha TaxID=104508 RepID=A0AAU9UYV9_EUPED|nr:unnamed protein product [Euphydryas editha]